MAAPASQLLHRDGEALDQLGGLRALVLGQAGEDLLAHRHELRALLLGERPSRGRQIDERDAPIGAVGAPAHDAVALEPAEHPGRRGLGHGRRLGELADRHGVLVEQALHEQVLRVRELPAGRLVGAPPGASRGSREALPGSDELLELLLLLLIGSGKRGGHRRRA